MKQGFINVFKNMLIIVVLICINFIVTAAVIAKPIAYINKQPVEAAELRREMLRYRSTIYSEYAAKFDLSKINNFWNANLGGNKPIDSLRNKALKALVEIKVQQQLLEKHNLWPYKNYYELQATLKKENEQRQQKVERKETIYGPIIYTEQVFFDYKFSNALIALKSYLVGEEIPLNDTLLLKHYAVLREEKVYSQKKTFESFKKQVQENYIEREYKKLVTAMAAKAIIKKIDDYNSVIM